MQILHRGVTGYDAEGMYTRNYTKVLLVVITRDQTSILRQIVSSIDKKAFMYCKKRPVVIYYRGC